MNYRCRSPRQSNGRDFQTLSFTLNFYHDRVSSVDSVQFSLHEWACLRTELIWIYDQAVAPESLHRVCQRSRGFFAWYLHGGNLRFRHEGRMRQIGPGAWFFLPAGTAEHFFSKDARLLSIQFLCQWPSGENFLSTGSGIVLDGWSYPALERSATRLERLVRRHFPEKNLVKFHSNRPADGPTFLRFQSYFIQWLEVWMHALLQNGAKWTRLRSGDDRPLHAVRLLNEAPIDGDYPRLHLRQETRLSEVHLNRLFLREFGLSPREYWNKRKLEFACRCLETSLMSVKEIAYRAGFKSDANFAVWFRGRTGYRPSQYRQRPNLP